MLPSINPVILELDDEFVDETDKTTDRSKFRQHVTRAIAEVASYCNVDAFGDLCKQLQTLMERVTSCNEFQNVEYLLILALASLASPTPGTQTAAIACPIDRRRNRCVSSGRVSLPGVFD